MVTDLSQFKKSAIDPNEPHMRVLKCTKCKSVEEVPDYEGPDGGLGTAEFDHALRFFVDQHLAKGCKKDGFTEVRFPTRFWVIPKVKEGIIAQLSEGAQGLDVFGTNAYAMSNNHQADAMSCWIHEHNQTKDCADYKSDKKQLKAGTSKERLALGLEKEGNGPKVYLCDYCPYKAGVVQGKFLKKNGYK